jgi:hypothetical protein
VILAVDPGVHLCGCALFIGDQLATAWLEEKGPRAIWSAVDPKWREHVRVIVEVPQVYGRSRSKGDPNDLINVALVAGAIVGLFPNTRIVRPREWKGDVPKEVVERAAREVIGDRIAAVQFPKRRALAHNIWDAVALGLFEARGTWRPR